MSRFLLGCRVFEQKYFVGDVLCLIFYADGDNVTIISGGGTELYRSNDRVSGWHRYCELKKDFRP